MKKIYLTLSLGTILFAFCTSCQKEDVTTEPEIHVVKPEPTPTEDVIDYSTYAKVLILGESDDMLSNCFPSRFINASTTASEDENYELVVVNKLESATSNAQAVSSCVKTFINGGAIIIFNSSYSDYVKFHEALMGAQGDEMIYDTPVRNIPCALYTISDMVKNTLASSESDIMPAVVMKATGAGYVFPSPKTVVISQSDGIEDEQTGEISGFETVVEGKENELCEPTPYSYGKLCEDILKWAETDDATPNGQLEDIANAGIDIPIWRNIYFRARDAGTDLIIERHVNFRDDYRVWSVYDTKNEKDLYLIRSSIVFEGSRVGPGPSHNRDCYDWYESNIVRGFYGPYLYEIESTAQMDGVEPMMSDISPSGSIGSTKYTCGFNWSISGGVTAGSSPGLNFGGSLGLSLSWDVDVPHLKMQLTLNNNKPDYKYTAGIVPDSYFTFPGYLWHDFAKDDLNRDIILPQKWIWTIPSKPGDVFYMKGIVSATLQMLGVKMGILRSLPSYHNAKYYGNDQFRIALPAPPRVDQRWRENCTPASDKLNQFLSLKYKDMFFHEMFHVPAHTEQDTTKISAFINDFTKNILPYDKQIWKDNGLTGTYTFTWKRAESDKNYKTFTYVVE